MNCSKSTWSSCKSAESHLKRELDTGVRIRFSKDNRMILACVGWLIAKRGESSTSISQYLSGLRMVHMRHGVPLVNLRPEIVQPIIKGRANKGSMNLKVLRMAMTTQVMRLLTFLLTNSSLQLEQKVPNSLSSVHLGLQENLLDIDIV